MLVALGESNPRLMAENHFQPFFAACPQTSSEFEVRKLTLEPAKTWTVRALTVSCGECLLVAVGSNAHGGTVGGTPFDRRKNGLEDRYQATLTT